MVEEQLGGPVDPYKDAKIVTGRVKWFNSAKGFGFLTTDDEVGDVFVHLSSLRQCGYQTLYEGMIITCRIVEGPKGLQAVEIINIKNNIEENDLETNESELSEDIIPEGDYQKATVKWFNAEKGYGFITTGQDSPDFFIHVKTMQKAGISILLPGQIVSIRVGKGPKGPQVACIKLQN